MAEYTFTERQVSTFATRINRFLEFNAFWRHLPGVATENPWDLFYNSYTTPQTQDPLKGVGLSPAAPSTTVDLVKDTVTLQTGQLSVDLTIDVTDMRNNNLMARSLEAVIGRHVDAVNKLVFQGNGPVTGYIGKTGIDEVADIAGADSDLTAFGDIKNGFAKMMSNFPEKYLAHAAMLGGVDVFVTPGIAHQLITNVDSYKQSEIEIVRKAFMGKEIIGNLKIRKIVSTSYLQASTLATTNQLILMVIPDPDRNGVVYGVEPRPISNAIQYAYHREVGTGYNMGMFIADTDTVIKSESCITTLAGT
jgi:hypothetical protein